MFMRPDVVDFDKMAAEERAAHMAEIFTDDKIAKLKRMLED